MTTIDYKVKLAITEKGVAFAARQALQNCRGVGSSPIIQATFSQQPTNQEVELLVSIEDEPLTEIIETAIEKSGRMPRKGATYSIKSIEPIPMQTRDPELNKKYGRATREIASLREELTTVKAELSKKEASEKTPLDSMLAYLNTLDIIPTILFTDERDLTYAHRLLSGEIEHNLTSYINLTMGTEHTEQTIEDILEFDVPDTQEMDALAQKYQIAKQELEFLDQLKQGKAPIPKTLQEEYIKVIESKDHESTVKEYEKIALKMESAEKEKQAISELKKRFIDLEECVDLVRNTSHELPLVFSFENGRLEIYTPFKVRKTNAGFMEDLRKELKTYFSKEVEQIKGTLVAYRIEDPESARESVDRVCEDTPAILRITGYSNIIPYKLG